MYVGDAFNSCVDTRMFSKKTHHEINRLDNDDAAMAKVEKESDAGDKYATILNLMNDPHIAEKLKFN
jgi:hypothetical protein